LADLERHPCATCRRNVVWANLPECKTVAYLYGQLELTKTASQPAEGILQIQFETRKIVRGYTESIAAAIEEMTAKMRNLAKTSNEVYE
ncbi:hypothetical protein PFISCL1PPCAC_7663, partial [Pristionchus fissidentatus]